MSIQISPGKEEVFFAVVDATVKNAPISGSFFRFSDTALTAGELVAAEEFAHVELSLRSGTDGYPSPVAQFNAVVDAVRDAPPESDLGLYDSQFETTAPDITGAVFVRAKRVGLAERKQMPD